jgi:3-methyl-2-oxobutanoate hydroxymethyltransferase
MKHSELIEYKLRGEKITCLTAYDASFAKIIDSAGTDIILVGDSLGMVIQGAGNTLAVTMQQMIHHTEIVAKPCQQALVIADMPFKSYENAGLALDNAKSLIAAGANMVKLEGGSELQDVFRLLNSNNINVCGHLGLQPQLVVDSSGYKIQGKDDIGAQKILDDALLLESLGVSVIVLECIPRELAKNVSQSLRIPTIGIGAGSACDGQVLVSYDMLGITSGRLPRFARNFMVGKGSVRLAIESFNEEVKAGTYPSIDETY